MRNALVFTFIAAFWIQGAIAQTDFTRIYGPEDQSVPTPTFVGAIGQQDAASIQEIRSFQSVAAASSWAGMQATGNFTDSLGNQDEATLTIAGSSNARLDVATPLGGQSTRISGPYGSIREINGSIHTLPPATALGGILAFPRLLSSNFPGPMAIVVDRGEVLVNGASLHRITIEAPAFPSSSTSLRFNSNHNPNITDFYFDPASHLLIKSASYAQLDTADPARYLIVITYGDYQTVGKALIPLNVFETVNGQRQWTLHLSSPSPLPAVDPSYFNF